MNNMNLPAPAMSLKRLERKSMLPNAIGLNSQRNSMLPRQSLASGKVDSAHRQSTARSMPYARTPGRPAPARNVLGAAGAQTTNSLSTRKSMVMSQSASGTSTRKSMAMASTPGRSVRQARPSMAGSLMPLTPGKGLAGLGASSKDTRPLRDRGYQARISEEIYDFLVLHKFENDMRHPLTPKSLKAPTQKDFVFIFQWLYKRMDPGYKFTKSIENEVFFVLKTIGYPFLESINKSQISAVGGQNWPVYLGMLHWMVELNKTLDEYDKKTSPGPKAVDNSENPSEDDNELDQIFIRYISKAYKAFLANEDDYTEYQEEMQKEFAEYSSLLNDEMEQRKEDGRALEEKHADLVKKKGDLVALESKGTALKSDLEKFKHYIETMESRKDKWAKVLEKIHEGLETAKEELLEIDSTKEDLQAKVKAQGLTPADIDKMNNERENLGRLIEKTATSLQAMSEIISEREVQAQGQLDTLDSLVHKYNAAVYTHSLPTPTINFDATLSDELLSLKPEEVLPGLSAIRSDLTTHRNDVASRIHTTQDDSLKLQDQLDNITEEISEKSDSVATLEAKLHTTRFTHETITETGAADTAASHAEVERLSRELNNMEMQANQGVMALNQRAQTIAMEYDSLKRNVERRREEMRSEVERMIFQVTDFKVLIQESLEDYETFATEEAAA